MSTPFSTQENTNLIRVGIFGCSRMAQAQERPRITEIQVRIDCNGCVQKIKKALQGINGISDVYIDLPKQKLTIIGCADPEKIIKAIKKARKTATIYSHSEVQEQPPTQPTDQTPPENETPQPPDDNKPPPDQPQPPPEQPQPEPQPPQQENPTTQLPPQENPNTHEQPPVNPNEPQNRHPHNEAVEEVHVIHHHPPEYPYRPRYGPGYNPEPPRYSNGPRYDRNYTLEEPRYSQSYNPGPHGDYNPSSYGSRFTGYSQGYEPGYNPGPPGRTHSHHGYGGEWNDRPEPSYRTERPHPVQVTHSYNQYRPQPNITQYEYVQSPPNATQYVQTPPNATQYEYVHSPPRFTPYARTESYYYYNNGDYQNDNSNNNSNGYMSSMFSEENPNACTIS